MPSSTTSTSCSTRPDSCSARARTHFSRFADLCRHLQLRGNLVPDGYLAALALEHRAELVTFDRGFGRYPRLRWRSCSD